MMKLRNKKKHTFSLLETCIPGVWFVYGEVPVGGILLVNVKAVEGSDVG